LVSTLTSQPHDRSQRVFLGFHKTRPIVFFHARSGTFPFVSFLRSFSHISPPLGTETSQPLFCPTPVLEGPRDPLRPVLSTPRLPTILAPCTPPSHHRGFKNPPLVVLLMLPLIFPNSFPLPLGLSFFRFFFQFRSPLISSPLSPS